ncbi:hypothetical protein FOH10_10395 [Nocardia otitidiscaviarum]|uniref:Uncharacterized protein n=1 Tax=Nocardia otitidiscaviarum TaxID=1823 RepID=A0A516NJK2_9NOCA|nr:hypothetical protein [Nocardia otitidiscaviarum]MCP9625064.1 hypothetical protein [Nocardia otitidiscaviarum]QDP79076.1 hypothetical protein FOH10_10395 [Nocardia otitidiscaviarum]
MLVAKGASFEDCAAPGKDRWTEREAVVVWALHREHPVTVCAAKAAARAILVRCGRLRRNRVLMPVEHGRHRVAGKHGRR